MKLKSTVLALTLAISAPWVSAADPVKPYVYSSVAELPNNAQEREIASLFDQWNAALKTGSAQQVVSLYAADAVLQPTVSNQVRNTPALIADYFDHFLALKPVGRINYREVRQLGNDAAMDSGVYTFTLTDANGKTRDVQARYTFLYEKVNGQWKILNHHSSAMPEPQPVLHASK